MSGLPSSFQRCGGSERASHGSCLQQLGSCLFPHNRSQQTVACGIAICLSSNSYLHYAVGNIGGCCLGGYPSRTCRLRPWKLPLVKQSGSGWTAQLGWRQWQHTGCPLPGRRPRGCRPPALVGPSWTARWHCLQSGRQRKTWLCSRAEKTLSTGPSGSSRLLWPTTCRHWSGWRKKKSGLRPRGRRESRKCLA
jgi:hypothetical protein